METFHLPCDKTPPDVRCAVCGKPFVFRVHRSEWIGDKTACSTECFNRLKREASCHIPESGCSRISASEPLTHEQAFRLGMNYADAISGKHPDDVFPNMPEELTWSFICGYFERNGDLTYHFRRPEISLTGHSHQLMEQIAAYWNVAYSGNLRLSAFGYRALDICGRMYANISFRQSRKYEDFTDLLNWEPLPNSRWFYDSCFKCKKLDSRAIVPSKTRVTDSGYDIYAVEFTYEPETGLYVADSRLAVEPIPGYYFDMVGRSSLTASGYYFIGGVGVIDRSYVGSLKMKLLKFRPDAPIPALPFKCGQIIPRKIIHVRFIETDSLNDSDRGDGGFGSTGNGGG